MIRPSLSRRVTCFEHSLYGCLIFTIGLGRCFYAGAAWSRAGEITTAGAWNDYVAQWAARIRRPGEVRVSRRG